jgi:ligand-binding sensor domain-containing protein
VSRPIVGHFYSTKDGLPSNWVMSLYQSTDGRLWVGTTRGLCQLLLRESSIGEGQALLAKGTSPVQRQLFFLFG